ncbi:MAG: hypothetical protein ACXAD7_03245 [Candidatus Kariarchaeaceae archaeon]|jgi:hypothetical protein
MVLATPKLIAKIKKTRNSDKYDNITMDEIMTMEHNKEKSEKYFSDVLFHHNLWLQLRNNK